MRPSTSSDFGGLTNRTRIALGLAKLWRASWTRGAECASECVQGRAGNHAIHGRVVSGGRRRSWILNKHNRRN